MKKTAKFITTAVFLLIGFFSLIFISHPQILAQETDKIAITTTHYSVLRSDIFILGGAYAGNIQKKPLTTYFEFKKNDSNLNTAENREETIPIVRDTDVEESGTFNTSPEFHLDTTYYFRAVGYLNDAPDQKFYGGVLSFRTGFPFISNIPFTAEFAEQAYKAMPYTPPVCRMSQVLIDGVCVEKKSLLEEDLTLVCRPPETLDLVKNICVRPPSTPIFINTLAPTLPEAPVATSTDSTNASSKFGGLVQCDDSPEHPCDFNALMDLINRIIHFILFNLALPLAAIMFAYAGFLLVTAGGADGKTKAKNIFTNAVIGLVLAVAAWLIVRTLLSTLGYNGSWIGL